MTLDLEPAAFRRALHHTSDVIARWYDGLEERPVFHGRSPDDVRAAFDGPLPEDPMPLEDVLDTVEADVFNGATLNASPRFTAYVMSGGNHVGILGDALASALNQNVAKWHVGASAAEMEKITLAWIAAFIGYPSPAGILVSGGSMANLLGIAVARKVKAPFDVTRDGLAGEAPLVAYTSTAAHHCHDKAADLLGLGHRHLRKVPVHDDDTMDVTALEGAIDADREAGRTPFCVIASGGAVNTGAVDPLDALADVCARHGLWLHVDAAFGGPAAAAPTTRDLFRGLERADSVALDPHKWLYAPFEVGCLLVRDAGELKGTFSAVAPYLAADAGHGGRTDLGEYGFQLSRSFRALKVWMAFKAYGAARFRAAIEDNVQTMRHLADLVDASPDFERLAPVPLSAVCFRYRTPDPAVHDDEAYLARLNQALLDAVESDGRAFVGGTTVHGRTALRACSVNHRLRREHVTGLLDVLRELGAECHARRPVESAGAGPASGPGP